MPEWIIAMFLIGALLSAGDMAKIFLEARRSRREAAVYDNHPQKLQMEHYADSFRVLAESFYQMPSKSVMPETGRVDKILEKEQQEVLMNYRIAYLGETMVNWCPQLGTVLANDEVVDGVSERGGFPVVQKKMRQWCLRVSAYAQRLLDGLDTIDWTESLKETQKNWIGRSEGAEIQFKVKDSDLEFTIFTTRADTMFGVTFMVLAPESELVAQVTTPEQKDDVDAYLERTKKRTERERISDRSVTGVFSGSYAVNPFTGEAVPIWISDYVLAGHHGSTCTRQPRLRFCQTFRITHRSVGRRLRCERRKFRCQGRYRM